MTAVEHDHADLWAALQAPFEPDWIEKLPKVLNREDRDKGRCTEGSRYTADGHACGGWHARAVHLDYVGHAGITMRLNQEVGPDRWSWEPLSIDPEGLPRIRGGEFWIRLTILGVTKLGVGDDFRSSKVAIGDALRNAAMRFGIGTYLWSKSDMALALARNDDDRDPPQSPPGPPPQREMTPAEKAGRDAARLATYQGDPALLDGVLATARSEGYADLLVELDGQSLTVEQAIEATRDRLADSAAPQPTSGPTREDA